jgi:copper(I)-binding protein
MIRILHPSVLALTLLSLGALGQQTGSTGVAVEGAWARASTGKSGAAYLSIVNRGTAPDRLLLVRTPVAEKATIHQSKMENGIVEMRPLSSITIPPGGAAQLKPGADHVMLMGLKQPLKEGQSFPLTLTFEKAGDVEVTVKVEKAGAMGPGASAGGSMPPMDHQGMK